MVDRQRKKAVVIDMFLSLGIAIRKKEHKKLGKCQGLREELEKMWKVKAIVVPVITGPLGVVTPKLGERLQQRSLSQRVQVKILHIYILYIYIFRKLSVLRNKLFTFCSASVLIQASRGNFKLRFAGKTCDWYM